MVTGSPSPKKRWPHLNLEGLLGVGNLLEGPEGDVEGEGCLRLDDAVVLAEGEVLPELVQPTQLPGHWEQGVVLQV